MFQYMYDSGEYVEEKTRAWAVDDDKIISRYTTICIYIVGSHTVHNPQWLKRMGKRETAGGGKARVINTLYTLFLRLVFNLIKVLLFVIVANVVVLVDVVVAWCC